MDGNLFKLVSFLHFPSYGNLPLFPSLPFLGNFTFPYSLFPPSILLSLPPLSSLRFSWPGTGPCFLTSPFPSQGSSLVSSVSSLFPSSSSTTTTHLHNSSLHLINCTLHTCHTCHTCHTTPTHLCTPLPAPGTGEHPALPFLPLCHTPTTLPTCHLPALHTTSPFHHFAHTTFSRLGSFGLVGSVVDLISSPRIQWIFHLGFPQAVPSPVQTPTTPFPLSPATLPPPPACTRTCCTPALPSRHCGIVGGWWWWVVEVFPSCLGGGWSLPPRQVRHGQVRVVDRQFLLGLGLSCGWAGCPFSDLHTHVDWIPPPHSPSPLLSLSLLL